MSKEPEFTVFTIGHSTRTLDEFISLLKTYEVQLVVDVRAVPRSRHNLQFNKETLPQTLKTEGIKYIHMPELGGLRRPAPDSVNLAWENKTFRGYADYMQTREFSENLLKLVALARENCIAMMCAEAAPWRCHRILIADALVVRHIPVKHILNATSYTNHELNLWASVEGTKITYPLIMQERPQRKLADFGNHFLDSSFSKSPASAINSTSLTVSSLFVAFKTNLAFQPHSGHSNLDGSNPMWLHKSPPKVLALRTRGLLHFGQT